MHVAESVTQLDVLIVGGGPAGLMAAERIATASPGARVLVVDAQRSAGRKFLLAGRSGLNISNAEALPALMGRFGGSAAWLARDAVSAYPPSALAMWADGLGQPLFTGTSGRLFPEAMRATPLLRAWFARLAGLGVTIETEWRVDIDDVLGGSAVIGMSGVGRRVGQDQGIRAHTVVLALGGASWPRTGSDGTWTDAFRRAGIGVEPLVAANVGALVHWSDVFTDRWEGQPIKHVALSADARTVTGDVVVTRAGLEGGPVYALTPELRRGSALTVNLRPDVTPEATRAALDKSRPGDSLTNRLRKAGLSKAAAALAVECGARGVTTSTALADLVHRLPVTVVSTGGISRAISSAGGVRGDEVDEGGMLRRRPGVFVAGEMLDWEAPTGGYLLQACWSLGCVVGDAVSRYRATHP